MADIIQLRRDSAEDWTSADPTLAAGEIGYETDTGKIKIGDGTTAWTSLAYKAAGTVLLTGTPANNQIAVWTDADTLEGTAGLTYNGTTLDITGNITLSGTVDGVDIAELPTPTYAATFTFPGTLEVATGTARFYFNGSHTITGARAGVGTAPTDADIQVDVNKNGTTVFTTQSNRPIIVADGFTNESGTPEVAEMAAGDYLTVDIDQVGSTVAGADLVVSVYYQ